MKNIKKDFVPKLKSEAEVEIFIATFVIVTIFIQSVGYKYMRSITACSNVFKVNTPFKRWMKQPPIEQQIQLSQDFLL